MTPEDYARLYAGRVTSFKVGGHELVHTKTPAPPRYTNRKQRRTWLAQQRRQKGK